MSTYFGFDAVTWNGVHNFVSYSKDDSERVAEIARELNNMRIPLWYDYGLLNGDEWEEEIMRHICGCNAMVIFLTADLFGRDRCFVPKERRIAMRNGKAIYYVWLDDIAKIDFRYVNPGLQAFLDDMLSCQALAVYNVSSPRAIAEKIVEEMNRGNASLQRKFNDAKGAVVQTAQPAPEPKVEVRVGDIVKFGQYPQGANGEIAPIEWRVLEINDGKTLLLSDKLLDYVKYDEERVNVTWETCTLRKWMNEEFIRKAFSSDEQSKIATVTNANPSNPEYGTKGGKATQDKVFSLSIDEVKKYFSTDKSRIAYTTDYAHKQGHDCKDRSDWWWLRSPGLGSFRAASVGSNGGVYTSGYFVLRSNVAVRLAFWLNL